MGRADQTVPDELMKFAGGSGASFPLHVLLFPSLLTLSFLPGFGSSLGRASSGPVDYGAPPASAAASTSSTSAAAGWGGGDAGSAEGWGAPSASSAPTAAPPLEPDWGAPAAAGSSLKPKVDDSDRISVSSNDTARASTTPVIAPTPAASNAASGWNVPVTPVVPTTSSAPVVVDQVDEESIAPPFHSRSPSAGDKSDHDGYNSSSDAPSSPEIGGRSSSPSPSPATSVDDLSSHLDDLKTSTTYESSDEGEGETGGALEPASSPVVERKRLEQSTEEDDEKWFAQFVPAVGGEEKVGEKGGGFEARGGEGQGLFV
jgi:hypothetical protein